MRYIIIPLLFLLSACTDVSRDTQQEKIRTLESRVSDLERENANLREENTLLSQGGIVPEGSSDTSLESLMPAGTTYEESSNASCIAKAQEHFIEK